MLSSFVINKIASHYARIVSLNLGIVSMQLTQWVNLENGNYFCLFSWLKYHIYSDQGDKSDAAYGQQ